MFYSSIRNKAVSIIGKGKRGESVDWIKRFLDFAFAHKDKLVDFTITFLVGFWGTLAIRMLIRNLDMWCKAYPQCFWGTMAGIFAANILLATLG